MSVDPESIREEFNDVDFLSKLEQACGCEVPDSLKCSVLNVVEDHCKSCISPIPVDLVSLGALPDDLKKLFSKLMNHVYSFKQKSQELIVKVLKEFADYESSSNRNSPSPDLRSMSENMNVVPEMIDPEVFLFYFFSFTIVYFCFNNIFV